MLRQTKVENGLVRGLPGADPRVTSFKGIPYAAPPIGDLRWKAPQPAKDWDGVLNAYTFAPISVQVPPNSKHNIYEREWNVDPDIEMSEDCLYLNVWTPANKTGEKLPVFVWYFGGGLQEGNTQEMEFNGERIARRGIVVVTVNYRVNVFGFLTHPLLTAENPEAPANFGSMDQGFATAWVKRNAEAFGGDPDNITIGGQSAGGGSVMTQLTSPKTKGLFNKAIIMSGMFMGGYEDRLTGGAKSLEDSEKLGVSLFNYMGIKTLEEARTIPAIEFHKKFSEWQNTKPFDGGAPIRMSFGTVVDGKYCVGNSRDMIAKGDFHRMPLIIGNTLDEFHSSPNFAENADFEAYMRGKFGSDADEILAITKAPTCAERCYKASFSPVEVACRHVQDSLMEIDGMPNTYYYQFGPDIPGWDNPGSFHSSDLWFFFESLAACWRPFTGKHYDLARQMCNYWANFMKTGDPNGPDADGRMQTFWEPYRLTRGAMKFTNGCHMSKPSEEAAITKFWLKQVK